MSFLIDAFLDGVNARRRHGLALARALATSTVLLFLAIPSVAQAADLIGPLRMTESAQGLVVGDYVGNQVHVLDPVTLQVTDALPIYSDVNALAFGKPLSVGWMNGRLYVGEERTGRIQVFQWALVSGKKRKALYGWEQVSPSLTADPVVQPSAIVADETLGWLFVASKGEGAVLVLDASGNRLGTIGGLDSAAPLVNPQAIALDRTGKRVFVTDDFRLKSGSMGETMYSVIQVYGYDGTPLGKIDGSTGMGNAAYKFARAQGVARDAAGRVYVADTYRHEVLVFAETATVPNTFSPLAKLGTKGIAPGELLMPTGVHVDAATSKVYVANTMLGRIEVFATVGSAP